MREREYIIQELWRRLNSVRGIQFTSRNSTTPPEITNLPAIQFFEMEDVVEDVVLRGASFYPVYRRRLSVIIEYYIAPSSEGSAGKELLNWGGAIKKSILKPGWTSKKVSVKEMRDDKVLRPATGEFVVGSSIELDLRYIEDIALMTTTSSTTSSTSSTASSTSSVSTTSSTVSTLSSTTTASSTSSTSSSSSTTITSGVTSSSSSTTTASSTTLSSTTGSTTSSSSSSTSTSSISSTTTTTVARDRWRGNDAWRGDTLWHEVP